MSSASHPRIVVVGSINTDLVVFAPKLPEPGQTVIGGDLFRGGGGKGANQAVAAARLGAEVSLIGRVGADEFGRGALDQLSELGVDVALVRQTAATHSGVALIVVDDAGENLIAVAPGANGRVSAEDVSDHTRLLCDADVVLLQLEVPIAAVLRAATIAHDAGVRVILNPAPTSLQPLPDELLAATDVIVPNESEATALTGVEVVDIASATRAAEELREAGPSIVIVTLGSQGALLLDDQGPRTIAPASVTAVDTTAAGDAFCGGLAVALARGVEIDIAAQYAAIVAGLAVTKPGAQTAMPHGREVEAFLEQARVEAAG